MKGTRPVVLNARGLRFSYGQLPVIAGLDFELREREVVALVGPSGCGKSTLLRVFAGLEVPDEGRVEVARYQSGKTTIRFLFQDYDAFPWLRVWDNVQTGSGPAPDPDSQTVRDILNRVGLGSEDRLYPAQLSVGMRKRLALARCVVRKPSVLLLDEPFASLDVDSKFGMYELVQDIVETTDMSVLIVTHDLAEAIFLCDRVFVCSHRPMQIRQEIEVRVSRPRSPSFTGEALFLSKLADLNAALRPVNKSVADVAALRDSAIQLDSDTGRELKQLLSEPSQLENLNGYDICQQVNDSIRRATKVGMGGRSFSMMSLCALLWYGARDREVVDTFANQIQSVAGHALQSITDPSFAQPEWGVVLVGVILAKWLKFSNAIWAHPDIERREFEAQVHKVIEFVASRDAPHLGVAVGVPVSQAAQALLEAWNQGFPSGLQPVIERALNAWPSTGPIEDMPQDVLDKRIAILSDRLPGSISQDELALYHLHLERTGDWAIFERMARCLR